MRTSSASSAPAGRTPCGDSRGFPPSEPEPAVSGAVRPDALPGAFSAPGPGRTEDAETDGAGTAGAGTEDPGRDVPGAEDPGTEAPGSEAAATEDAGTVRRSTSKRAFLLSVSWTSWRPFPSRRNVPTPPVSRASSAISS